ncbi:hypothetical protein [Nonomuraea aridisoli]|uniref:hypothetical protein n=1 Tax=Nonomuraea aridisoli TaxID=2070368 RepID=UPI0015E8E347|nr:hypothetical protein [Nonomuraea aridisoli]
MSDRVVIECAWALESQLRKLETRRCEESCSMRLGVEGVRGGEGPHRSPVRPS